MTRCRNCADLLEPAVWPGHDAPAVGFVRSTWTAGSLLEGVPRGTVGPLLPDRPGITERGWKVRVEAKEGFTKSVQANSSGVP